MNPSSTSRDHGIDLAKAVAIFGVIVIHTCAPGSFPIGSFNFLSAVFWGSITRASVPIFFLCSGVLFLNPEKEVSIRRLWSRTILRIALSLFFCAFAYKLYYLLAGGTVSIGALLQAVKEVLLFKHEFHLYFLHIILLFYAMLPIVRRFVSHATRTELRYALGLWFAAGILYPTLRPFWPFSLLAGIPSQWLLNQAYAAMGYGLLGFYLKRYGISLRASVLFAAGGFAVIFGGTVGMSLYKDAFYAGFLEGMTVGPALLAAGAFGLFLRASEHLRGKGAALVTYLSKASFCVYLVHVFVLNLFTHFGLTAHLFLPVLSIPAVSFCNLGVSLCVYFVLSKIPVVNRWLI